MSEHIQEHYTYDEESDLLDVYFDEHAGKRPVWTIELTDNITIGIDREARKAVSLGLLDLTQLIRRTPWGPRSFPVTGLSDLPLAERDLVLELLTSEPVSRWIDTSTVEQLPDSPFAVVHLEPVPPEVHRIVPIPA